MVGKPHVYTYTLKNTIKKFYTKVYLCISKMPKKKTLMLYYIESRNRVVVLKDVKRIRIQSDDRETAGRNSRL